MLDKDIIRDALDSAVSHSSADQTEALVSSSENALTRFSNNQIHQNVAQTNISISIRAIVDKKTGYATTNKLDAKSIKNTVDKAIENAKFLPQDADFTSLPGPQKTEERDLISKQTEEFTPKDRAVAIQKLVQIAEPQNLTAAGAFSTGHTMVGVANNLGINTVSVITEADIKTVFMGETGSAFGSALKVNVGDIDVEHLGNKVKERALASQNPIEIEPGVFPVILSPNAMADMISFAAFAGFGALSKQEERSFMGNNIGKQIVSPLVSIWDDAFDPGTIGLPFDFEGVPKKKISFIENGIAKGFCYDSYTARKEGTTSTGHALPAPNAYGPLPLNLIMAPGTASIDNIVKDCERAILVNRFHYTNLEDPLKTIFTGMTRDGTFLIENGKVAASIKNLRFTQSIVEALACIENLSSERKLREAILGGAFVPWAKISAFKFTGITQF